MADYDVGAAGLLVPPSSAVLTTYRPSILVRNYGIHARTATGYIRIYKAGLLVFSSDVYSGTIQPGATGVALADKYWPVPALGQYIAQGYVTCQNDQVPANNALAPVAFTVTSEPPPPPPIVTPHASQHEDGGDDQLTVDGLPGQLAEAQIPFDHASNHQAGGSDVLNVAGLAGQLAEEQKPAGHGNEAHSPSFASYPAIADAVGVHNSLPGPHASATNLEKVANRGTANGYAPLGADAKVPLLNLPALAVTFDTPIPTSPVILKPGESDKAAHADHLHRVGVGIAYESFLNNRAPAGNYSFLARAFKTDWSLGETPSIGAQFVLCYFARGHFLNPSVPNSDLQFALYIGEPGHEVRAAQVFARTQLAATEPFSLTGRLWIDDAAGVDNNVAAELILTIQHGPNAYPQESNVLLSQDAPLHVDRGLDEIWNTFIAMTVPPDCVVYGSSWQVFKSHDFLTDSWPE